MTNTHNGAKFRISILTMIFLVSACSRADVIPDMAALRHQIEKNDPDVVTILTASAEARSYLQKIHPGAEFYLALSLQQKKHPQDAAILFRAQLETDALAWKGPSFRAWLACLQDLKQWDEILGQSPALLQKATALGTGDQAKIDAALSTEAWQKAMMNAFLELKQVDKAWQFAKSLLPLVRAESETDIQETVPEAPDQELDSAPVELGQSTLPAWLLAQLALTCVLRFDQLSVPLSVDVVDDLVPYVLGIDAREGHSELYWILQASPVARPQATPTERALLKVLQAKDLLARGQAVSAYNAFRELLLPVGKARPKDMNDARLLHKGLFALFDRFDKRSGIPIAFFRDFFNAARLAGQLSDGIGQMTLLMQQLVDTRPAYRKSALRPYLLELKARLLRAKGDQRGAAEVFGQALTLAVDLEKSGLLAVSDRRRMQWYLLRSITDQYESPGTGPILNVRSFLDAARGTDDPEYFADVMERAVLLLGGREDWAGLETLYTALGPHMDPTLQARVALILARAAQLGGSTTSAQKARFERLSIAARDQLDSLYCRIVATWMRGEALDMDALLASQRLVHEFDGAISDASRVSPQDFASQVAEGYVAVGMLEQGTDYIWEHRKLMGNARFARIGMSYVAAGRYRQGLRMLESLRVRIGHPSDETMLAAFYPRPFGTELAKAVEGTVVPEWLMYALVRTESNFDTGADSNVGARGLAQLMPSTAKLVASGLGMENFDLLSPAVNLKLGSVFLQDQYTVTKDWPQAIAAYNAGIGRVRGWIRKGMNPDPILFSELIPFEETRGYVRRIIESSLLYTRLYYHLDPAQVLSLLYKKSDTSGR